MPNYKESAVSGVAYVRASSVLINNPKGGQPTVQFFEERFVELDGDATSRPMGPLAIAFDPSAVIALRDPITGELTGQTTTQGAVHAALYSLYIQSALERDAT